MREGLCGEAICLVRLLASHSDTGLPKVHALSALFYLQAARLDARVDGEGNLLLLAEQEREKWDQTLLSHAAWKLDQAGQGDALSEYDLQAAIACIHARNASYAETGWPQLLELYNAVFAMAPSPVVALNRAIAQSMVEGPEAAVGTLDQSSTGGVMRNYYLLPAVRADFLRRLGRTAEAAVCYAEALTCPCSKPERRWLSGRPASLRSL